MRWMSANHQSQLPRHSHSRIRTVRHSSCRQSPLECHRNRFPEIADWLCSTSSTRFCRPSDSVERTRTGQLSWACSHRSFSRVLQAPSSRRWCDCGETETSSAARHSMNAAKRSRRNERKRKLTRRTIRETRRRGRNHLCPNFRLPRGLQPRRAPRRQLLP